MRRLMLGLALVANAALAAVAWSQDSPMKHGEMQMGEGMKGCMQRMAEMDARSGVLDDLVERMQSAEGAEKVAAMEKVVMALVAERRDMHERMKSMPRMMCGAETGAAVPARAHGVVKKLDVGARTVTLDHGDIPGLMKAMTMTFDVAPGVALDDLRPGAEVDFWVKEEGGTYTVTEIHRSGG